LIEDDRLIYQKIYQAKLKELDIKSPDDLGDDKKRKEFFDEVDEQFREEKLKEIEQDEKDKEEAEKVGKENALKDMKGEGDDENGGDNKKAPPFGKKKDDDSSDDDKSDDDSKDDSKDDKKPPFAKKKDDDEKSDDDDKDDSDDDDKKKKKKDVKESVSPERRLKTAISAAKAAMSKADLTGKEAIEFVKIGFKLSPEQVKEVRKVIKESTMNEDVEISIEDHAKLATLMSQFDEKKKDDSEEDDDLSEAVTYPDLGGDSVPSPSIMNDVSEMPGDLGWVVRVINRSVNDESGDVALKDKRVTELAHPWVQAIKDSMINETTPGLTSGQVNKIRTLMKSKAGMNSNEWGKVQEELSKILGKELTEKEAVDVVNTVFREDANYLLALDFCKAIIETVAPRYKQRDMINSLPMQSQPMHCRRRVLCQRKVVRSNAY
jgi:hypothetical protein